MIQHNLDRYRVGQGWDDPDRAPVPPAPVPDEPLSEPERLLRQGKYQQALDLARDEMAAGSPTLDQQIALGRVLLAWERETEAQQHLERARGQLGHQSEQSSRHIRVLLDLAYLRSLQGDPDGALALLESGETMAQQILPQADSLRGDLLAERAFVQIAKSDVARAEETLLTALAFCADHLPENHETTARCLLALAQLAVQQRRPEEALSRLGDALAIGEQHLSLQHPFLAKALALATNLLLELGVGSRALPLALQGRETISTVLGSGHPRTWALDDLFERALTAANT
jgi:tetratricopeptide (TPR) repeat protein